MRVKKLKLKQFRNYDALELTLDPGVNLFFGPNGSGKTNLLEAVHYCALGRSHRTAQDQGGYCPGLRNGRLRRYHGKAGRGSRRGGEAAVRRGKAQAGFPGRQAHPAPGEHDGHAAMRDFLPRGSDAGQGWPVRAQALSGHAAVPAIHAIFSGPAKLSAGIAPAQRAFAAIPRGPRGGGCVSPLGGGHGPGGGGDSSGAQALLLAAFPGGSGAVPFHQRPGAGGFRPDLRELLAGKREHK